MSGSSSGNGVRLPPKEEEGPKVPLDEAANKELFWRRDAAVDKLSLLVTKYFDFYPEWKAEMCELIRQKRLYEEIKRLMSRRLQASSSGSYPFDSYSYRNHGRMPDDPGMQYYGEVFGYAPLPSSWDKLECTTPYGFLPGQHICNDDTLAQMFYACTNGRYPTLNEGVCAPKALNLRAPSALCNF